MVERLAESKNDKALEFIQNVKQYVKNNYRVTKKQMEALNKVYKRCGEDLLKYKMRMTKQDLLDRVQDILYQLDDGSSEG